MVKFSEVWRRRRSCDQCRARKVRCEYSSPNATACLQCVKHKLQCTQPEGAGAPMLEYSGPVDSDPSNTHSNQQITATEVVNQSLGAPPAVPTAAMVLKAESMQEKSETDRLFGAFAADNPSYAPHDLLRLPIETLRREYPSLVLAGAAAAAAASDLAQAKPRISLARLTVSAVVPKLSLDTVWARTVLAAYCLPLSDAGLIELFALASTIVSFCSKMNIELRETPHPLASVTSLPADIGHPEKAIILAVCALLASTAYLSRNHGIRIILDPIINSVRRLNLGSPCTVYFEAIILSYTKLRDAVPSMAGLCSPAAVSLCWKQAFAEMQKYSGQCGLFGLYVRLRILRAAATRCALLDEGGNGTFAMSEIETETAKDVGKLLETMKNYDNEHQLLLSEFDFGVTADSGITLWLIRVCCLSVGLSSGIEFQLYAETVKNFFAKLFEKSFQARTSFYRVLEMLDMLRFNPERIALEPGSCLDPPWKLLLLNNAFTVEHAVIRAALDGKAPTGPDANPFTNAFAALVRDSF